MHIYTRIFIYTHMHIHTYSYTHIFTERNNTHPHMHDMRRLRLVGSLKLNISFAKEPYTRDYILQNRLIIWRSLLIVATPYGRAYAPSLSSSLSLTHNTHITHTYNTHTRTHTWSSSKGRHVILPPVTRDHHDMGWLQVVCSLKW